MSKSLRITVTCSNSGGLPDIIESCRDNAEEDSAIRPLPPSRDGFNYADDNFTLIIELISGFPWDVVVNTTIAYFTKVILDHIRKRPTKEDVVELKIDGANFRISSLEDLDALKKHLESNQV